jgi:hypothetical protein
VYSDQNAPITNFTITSSNSFLQIPHTNSFTLENLIFGDTVVVAHINYLSHSFVLDSTFFKRDFTELKITLIRKDIEKQEIVITESNLRLEFGGAGINVIDFLPTFDNKYVVYYSKGNTKKLAGYNHSTIQESIVDNSTTELLLDCMGSFHAMGSKHVLQYYSDSSGLRFFEPVERKIFDNNLKNLVSKTDNNYVFYTVSNHNKSFELLSIGKKGKNKIFEYTDVEGLGAAQNSYNKIINRYMYICPTHENLISNGVWDGDVVRLFLIDTVLVPEIGLYRGIFSQKIRCYPYGMLDEIVVLNAENGECTVLDLFGKRKSQFMRPLLLSKDIKIVHDFYLDKLYLLHENQGQTVIHLIDYNNSKIEQIAVLPWVGKVASNGIDNNYKILGNRIYFRKKDSITEKYSLYSYGMR